MPDLIYTTADGLWYGIYTHEPTLSYCIENILSVGNNLVWYHSADKKNILLFYYAHFVHERIKLEK